MVNYTNFNIMDSPSQNVDSTGVRWAFWDLLLRNPKEDKQTPGSVLTMLTVESLPMLKSRDSLWIGAWVEYTHTVPHCASSNSPVRHILNTGHCLHTATKPPIQ